MMKFPPFSPFPLICPRASKKGGNEKNVKIMLKWWNKQIKCQNNAKMVEKKWKNEINGEKGEKRNK